MICIFFKIKIKNGQIHGLVCCLLIFIPSSILLFNFEKTKVHEDREGKTIDNSGLKTRCMWDLIIYNIRIFYK